MKGDALKQAKDKYYSEKRAKNKPAKEHTTKAARIVEAMASDGSGESSDGSFDDGYDLALQEEGMPVCYMMNQDGKGGKAKGVGSEDDSRIPLAQVPPTSETTSTESSTEVPEESVLLTDMSHCLKEYLRGKDTKDYSEGSSEDAEDSEDSRATLPGGRYGPSRAVPTTRVRPEPVRPSYVPVPTAKTGKYQVVTVGRTLGLFHDDRMARQSYEGYPGEKHYGFKSLEEAENHLRDSGVRWDYHFGAEAEHIPSKSPSTDSET